MIWFLKSIIENADKDVHLFLKKDINPEKFLKYMYDNTLEFL